MQCLCRHICRASCSKVPGKLCTCCYHCRANCFKAPGNSHICSPVLSALGLQVGHATVHHSSSKEQCAALAQP